jgi:hypothetical protein
LDIRPLGNAGMRVSPLPTLALVQAVLTAVTAAAVPVYFGARKPGYSHVRDTISELGEIGSPVGARVSYVGFLATGILVWVFSFVAARAFPDESTETFYLLSLVGAGYVGGGIFRCDRGAPFIGSWRNTLHNIFGCFEYVGAAGAFTTLKRSELWSPLSELMGYAGGLVLVCLWGISFPHPFRGLVQRVAETTIFAGVVLMGWWVYRAAA